MGARGCFFGAKGEDPARRRCGKGSRVVLDFPLSQTVPVRSLSATKIMSAPVGSHRRSAALIQNSLKRSCGFGVLVLAAAMLFGVVGASTAHAQGDDSLERINAQFRQVPTNKRSDLVVLPVLEGIQDPPASLTTLMQAWINRPAERAALVAAQGNDWGTWKAWAEGDTQKAVLATLPKVTEELDPRRAFAFAQPYGTEGVSVELITKEMYTDLGDPPLLARAQHLYMPKLRHMETLVHVEASRLVEEGKIDDALKLLTQWTLFARQFADRPMLAEKLWALEAIELGLVRLRDVAYADFGSSPRKATVAVLVDTVEKLLPRSFLDLDRLALPEGEYAAKQQLVARVMDRNGGVNAREFSKELARITTVDRPLRRFAAAAYWDGVRGAHEGDLETRQELERLRNDWTIRWNLSYFDPILQNKTEYQLKVAGRPQYAMLDVGLAGMEALFPLRQRLKVEAAGTRMSLAAYAFVVANNRMPPGLTAVRPAFTKGAPIDKDPFSTPSKQADLSFFVPGRDTPKGPQGQEQAYVVSLFPQKPLPEFEIPMRSNQFVIYSVGPDDLASMSLSATQDRTGVRGDYLLWPPFMSLGRTYLKDRGELR